MGSINFRSIHNRAVKLIAGQSTKKYLELLGNYEKKKALLRERMKELTVKFAI